MHSRVYIRGKWVVVVVRRCVGVALGVGVADSCPGAPFVGDKSYFSIGLNKC